MARKPKMSKEEAALKRSKFYNYVKTLNDDELKLLAFILFNSTKVKEAMRIEHYIIGNGVIHDTMETLFHERNLGSYKNVKSVVAL